ncbi:M20 family metallopeptidase [Vibrio sp. SS-MA-C1-2]|uniref:M20 family metallopeptidase n=1 Tax=Vibrio sp. SS-MA-C1-2 TaxID=2908646 RepID=UPI0038FBF08A
MNFELATYLKELTQLVNVDCGTKNPQGVAKIADILTPMFESIGFTVTRHHIDDAAGPCLHITNQPDADHYDIMLSGHMDTVFPDGTVENRPFSMDDKMAYGPGVTDMKSGILSAWYALQGLSKETLANKAIVVALNCDEEIGSYYSRPWIESIAKKSELVLVCEAARPTGNLIRSRKGNAKYQIDFHGKASHAGSALAEGVNAIYELSHWSLAIKDLVNLETGTTMNVGIISGGVAVNVVPDSAQAIVDLRFWNNDEAEEIHNTLNTMSENPFIEGASITVNRLAFKPSMVPTEKTEALISLVSQQANKLNIPHGWEDAGGGSDGNFTAALGIPTLDGFGPMGAGFHSDKEYLVLDSIEPRIKLLTAVMQEVLA